MDSASKLASNVTLINFTEQETYNTTAERREPVNYYGDTSALLWRVISPILISAGTIGNVMTIFALLGQKNMTSTALFLFALALSDTLILFSGLLRDWMRFTWELDIRLLSNAMCKANSYLIYCSIQLSSWLIVAVTLERTACVLFPHKVRLVFSRQIARLIIVTIMIAVFGINIILPVIVDLNGYEGMTCAPSTKGYMYLYYVYSWIDFTLFFGAPFPLLLIGNVIIVVQLARSRSRRQRMNISGQVRDTRLVSILIIAICVLFLITMTPMAVFLVYYNDQDIVERQTDQYHQFLYTVCNLVSYFNPTFNFALYVFSGSKFRKELKSLLCCQATQGTSLFEI